jgi:hypothetical protein
MKRKPVGCVGCRCKFAEYKIVRNGPGLFCHYANEAVFDLLACPIKKWDRDEHGEPEAPWQRKQRLEETLNI